MPPAAAGGQAAASILGLAEAQLGAADARFLRGARLSVALFDRDLVVRIARRFQGFLAGLDLLGARILAGIGRHAVDLGVGLSLDELGLRLLGADVLPVSGEIVAFFERDIVVSMLRRLAWSSVPSPSFTPARLNEIVARARCNNERHHVSGMLLYTGAHFLGVLEGAE